MIRTLVLLALCAISLCVDPLDQSELYGRRLGQGPFCDSQCLPSGEWRLRRDFLDSDILDSNTEDAFYWLADGPPSWWSRGCGDWVNGIVLGDRNPFIDPRNPLASQSETRSNLEGCDPGRIYIIKQDVGYDHQKGQFATSTVMEGSYVPTTDNWNSFVDTLYDYLFKKDELYTYPWNLLRLTVDIGSESVTNSFNDDLELEQAYIANYESNFCSFSGSTEPIAEQFTCNFDETFDTDDIQYITWDFCDYLAPYSRLDVDFGDCGSSDDGDRCDELRFYSLEAQRSIPGKRLKQVTASIVSNQQVKIEEATEEEIVEDRRRAWNTQPIPRPVTGPDAVGIFELAYYTAANNAIGSALKYTYVPYTSSVTAPYCAYRN